MDRESGPDPTVYTKAHTFKSERNLSSHVWWRIGDCQGLECGSGACISIEDDGACAGYSPAASRSKRALVSAWLTPGSSRYLVQTAQQLLPQRRCPFRIVICFRVLPDVLVYSLKPILWYSSKGAFESKRRPYTSVLHKPKELHRFFVSG